MKLIPTILYRIWGKKPDPWERFGEGKVDFLGAGCMFVNHRYVLAGITKQWGESQAEIDGFGGKRKGNETWKQCAFRETVEEFFGVEKVKKELLGALERVMIPQKALWSDESKYVTLVYDIEQLGVFLRVCARSLKKVPLYHCCPRTVEDLMLCRKLSDGAEVSHILLWPLYYQHTTYEIAPHFHGDIQRVNHNV